MKYIITLPALLAYLLLLCLSRSQPAIAQYAVDTTLGGLPLKTTVDSRWAQALLTSTLDRGIMESLACESGGDTPSLDQLGALSRRLSPDTATAALARCLLQRRDVALAQSLFVEEINKGPAALRVTAAELHAHRDDYTLVFVPGWGYLAPDNPTGADLAMPRAVVEAQGFTTVLAPIPSNGSIEDGAEVVAAVARDVLATGKNIIFVSASSGGPVVAHAIATGGFDTHPGLRGWLNICGILRGSPVVDKLLFWPASLVLRGIALYEGWEYDSLVSLSRHKSVPRFQQFHAPEQLTIVNYVGIAFSGQTSPYAQFFTRLLRRQGPSDGLTFITEAMAPGYTILGVGSDHFIMEDPEIVRKTGSLLPVLLALIERQRAQPVQAL